MEANQIRIKLGRAPEIGETLYDFNSPIGKVTSARPQEDGKWLLEVEVEYKEAFAALQKKLKKRWKVAARTAAEFKPGETVGGGLVKDPSVLLLKKEDVCINERPISVFACGGNKPMRTKYNILKERAKEVDEAAKKVQAELEGKK